MQDVQGGDAVRVAERLAQIPRTQGAEKHTRGGEWCVRNGVWEEEQQGGSGEGGGGR
jgi:hypothetical protein